MGLRYHLDWVVEIFWYNNTDGKFVIALVIQERQIERVVATDLEHVIDDGQHDRHRSNMLTKRPFRAVSGARRGGRPSAHAKCLRHRIQIAGNSGRKRRYTAL